MQMNCRISSTNGPFGRRIDSAIEANLGVTKQNFDQDRTNADEHDRFGR
ncbi:MAG: hypothetical protein WCE63_17120 [Acidobacteriaceae bacterium]